MAQEYSLPLPYGVKILNPKPSDPRLECDSLAAIQNDPTYYVGLSGIANLAEPDGAGGFVKYDVVGGSAGAGWVFESQSSKTVKGKVLREIDMQPRPDSDYVASTIAFNGSGYVHKIFTTCTFNRIGFLIANSNSANILYQVLKANVSPAANISPEEEYTLIQEGTIEVDSTTLVQKYIWLNELLTLEKDEYLMVLFAAETGDVTVGIGRNSTNVSGNLQRMYFNLNTAADLFADTGWKRGSSTYNSIALQLEAVADYYSQIEADNKISSELASYATKKEDFLEGQVVVAKSDGEDATTRWEGVAGFRKIETSGYVSGASMYLRLNTNPTGDAVVRIYKHNSVPASGDIPNQDYTLLKEILVSLTNVMAEYFFDFGKTQVVKDEYIIIAVSTLTSENIRFPIIAEGAADGILYIDTTDYENVFDNNWTRGAPGSGYGNSRIGLYLKSDTSEVQKSFITETEFVTGLREVQKGLFGDADFSWVGNGAYTKILKSQKISGVSVNFSSNVGGTETEFRVYKKATAPASNDVPEANWTLLGSKIIALDSDYTKAKQITFPSVDVTEGEYIVVCAYSPGVSTKVPRYTYKHPYSNGRVLYCDTVNSDCFTEPWRLGGADSYSNVPFALLISSPTAEIPEINITQTPKITLPSKIHAVVGLELALYHDGFILDVDNGPNALSSYRVDILCDIGISKQRYYSLTPIEGDVGNHTLTVNIYDVEGTLLLSKSITIVVVSGAALSDPSAAITMLGDSLNSYAGITQKVADNMAVFGGNIPNFYGMRGTFPEQADAIGGWKFYNFISQGVQWYKFLVSGVTSVGVNAIYSNNGSNWKVLEVNITAGTGYIKCERDSGSNDPLASGTLAFVSGSGDATIAFSSWILDPANPYWNPSTDEVDVAYRRGLLGLATPFDVATIQLGVNDCFGGDTIEVLIDNAKVLIDAFIADGTGAIVVNLPSSDGNTLGGWGANYGAERSKLNYQNRIYELRKAMIDEFDNGSYAANVYVGAVGLVIDRFYGYDLSDQVVGSRFTETEKVHTNAVHPGTNGYWQMADYYTALLKSFLS